MADFVTVTANPAVDRILMLPGARLGEVNRALSVTVGAGGKGVNAARVLRTLGADVVATGLAGGPEGEGLLAGLAAEGIVSDFVALGPRRTRLATVIVDTESGVQTVFNEPGPEASPADIAALEEALARHARRGGTVLLCGSLPPGLAPDSYARLISAARSAGAATLVDCSGTTLAEALKAGPTVVKVNRSELGAIGFVVPDWNIDGQRVVEQVGNEFGLEAVVVTGGSDGALLWKRGMGMYIADVPRVDVVSAVGSGDSFAAGLAFGLRSGSGEVAEALRLACACGAANAMNSGAGEISRRQVERVSGKIEIVKVA